MQCMQGTNLVPVVDANVCVCGPYQDAVDAAVACEEVGEEHRNRVRACHRVPQEAVIPG